MSHPKAYVSGSAANLSDGDLQSGDDMQIIAQNPPETMSQHECPFCRGEKGSMCHINTGLDSSKHRWEWVECDRCNGSGTVSQEVIDQINEGRLLSCIRGMNRVGMIELADRFECSCAALSAVFSGRVHHSSIPGLKEYLEGLQ